MPEEGSIESNLAQGKGIIEKKPFEVVGLNKKDLETGGHSTDEVRGRGRPPLDKNWTTVGNEVEKEQKGKK